MTKTSDLAELFCKLYRLAVELRAAEGWRTLAYPHGDDPLSPKVRAAEKRARRAYEAWLKAEDRRKP